MYRYGFHVPCRLPLLHRIVVDEDMAVGLFIFDFGVVFRGHSKATRINVEHVNTRLALNNPLGQLPAGTTGRRHPKAMRLAKPEVWQPKGRADHRVTIGRVGNRAVDNIFDAKICH